MHNQNIIVYMAMITEYRKIDLCFVMIAIWKSNKKTKGVKAMIKEYVINYKVRSLPYWYVFTCYAENSDSAISAFLKEEPFGIESFKIVAVYDI